MESLSPSSKKPTGLEALELFLEKVEGKLQSFGQEVEAAADHAQIQTHLGFKEAEAIWNKKRDEILAAATRLQAAQIKQQEKLDHGRVQLHLGKEEAKQAAAKLRERLETTEREMGNLSRAASADAKAALGRLKDAYGAIKGALLH